MIWHASNNFIIRHYITAWITGHGNVILQSECEQNSWQAQPSISVLSTPVSNHSMLGCRFSTWSLSHLPSMFLTQCWGISGKLSSLFMAQMSTSDMLFYFQLVLKAHSVKSKATFHLVPLSCIYFAHIFPPCFVTSLLINTHTNILSATFQPPASSFPMIFSPSVSLSYSLSRVQLRNTVTGPKNTGAPAKRGEDKQRCKLLQHEISPPLQLSTSSSVMPLMKHISLRAALSSFLNPSRYLWFYFSSFIFISLTLNLTNFLASLLASLSSRTMKKKGDQRTCFSWVIPQLTACHLDLTSDCCNSIKFWDEVDSHSGGGLLKLLLKVLCGSGGALSSLKITLMMPSWCH